MPTCATHDVVALRHRRGTVAVEVMEMGAHHRAEGGEEEYVLICNNHANDHLSIPVRRGSNLMLG